MHRTSHLSGLSWRPSRNQFLREVFLTASPAHGRLVSLSFRFQLSTGPLHSVPGVHGMVFATCHNPSTGGLSPPSEVWLTSSRRLSSSAEGPAILATIIPFGMI